MLHSISHSTFHRQPFRVYKHKRVKRYDIIPTILVTFFPATVKSLENPLCEENVANQSSTHPDMVSMLVLLLVCNVQITITTSQIA